MALLVVLLLAFRLVRPSTSALAGDVATVASLPPQHVESVGRSALAGDVATVASLPPQHVESVGGAPPASMLRGASSTKQSFDPTAALSKSDSRDCGDKTPARIPQLGHVLRGYNIYMGSPLSGQVDPGLVSASIFEETYRNKETTGDCEYQKPDGMDLVAEEACSFDFASTKVSNSSEYESSLDAVARVEVSAVKGSFSASTDYDIFMKRSTTEHLTRVEYHAKCNQFQTWLRPGQLPPFTNDFRLALGTLAAEPSEATFFDFFDTWGTHFLDSARLGARYGEVSYLSQRGVSELDKQGVSVEVAAKYAGFISLGGSMKNTSEASKTFEREQMHKKQVSVGVAPPRGADAQALDEWVQQTRKTPLPMSYTLKSLCEVLEAGTAKECLSAAPRYCHARVESWRSRYPSARCDSLTPTTLTTTTTTPVSRDCMGSPPRCCSGGWAGNDGQYAVDNFVVFEGLLAIGQHDIVVEWSTDTCSVTQSQPFGQGDYGPSSGPGLEVVAPNGKRNSIVVHAGRSNDKQNAEAFCSELGAANLLGIYQHKVSKPDELNFAFAGTLTLTFQGKTLTFPDFRLGQGQKGFYKNWWIGSAGCRNSNGEALQCESQEGDRIQFRGKGSNSMWTSYSNVFEVGYA